MGLSRREFFKVGTGGAAAAFLLGFDATPVMAQARELKIARTTETRSICPYCSVSCGVIIHTLGDKAKNVTAQVVHVEGDPEDPINRGTLCPKGADTYELHTHPGRLKKVKYRAPYSRKWEEIELETAMDMVADRLWETRDRTFQEKREGESLMQTTAIAHLGGATLDNEENYLIKKLFTAGLGMVCVSNQARI